nr:sigma-70 family RNA polymerase sigma factor [Micromonospora sp. DSM 115978]
MRTGQGSVADAAGTSRSGCQARTPGAERDYYPAQGAEQGYDVERCADAEQGYAELVARHSGPIRAYALRLTGNRSTAEDVVQETLLRAWRHQESLAGRGDSVRGWLVRVAHNIAIDLLRRRRAVYPTGDDSWDTLQRPVPDHADTVATNAMLRPALRRLTAEHRDVIFELYYRRSSLAEAAEAIGIPLGTVKSRAHYAVRVLRADLLPKTAAAHRDRPNGLDRPTGLGQPNGLEFTGPRRRVPQRPLTQRNDRKTG